MAGGPVAKDAAAPLGPCHCPKTPLGNNMELLNPCPSWADGGSGDLQVLSVWEKPRPPFGAASAGFCLL